MDTKIEIIINYINYSFIDISNKISINNSIELSNIIPKNESDEYNIINSIF